MHDPANELRRIPLPRTRVNKGKKSKGRGLASPTPSAQALFLAVHSPTRLALPHSSKPDVTNSEGLVWTNVNIEPSGAMN
jgi:hypothetical protein